MTVQPSTSTTEQRRAALLAAANGLSAKPDRELFVSYAWGDETPEGRQREAQVDELCRRAQALGLRILRDRSTLQPGDRISSFMHRLGNGDRVFAFLSDKYLRSPYCMSELCQVWRNCRQQEDEFMARTRVFVLPCARIWTLPDRAAYSAYWLGEYERVEGIIREHGSAAVGMRGMALHQESKQFALTVADLLSLISDVVHPQSFAEFAKAGFEGTA